ncbi:MAG: HEAT repeat domain-containing protein [Planctomycetota bacterium]
MSRHRMALRHILILILCSLAAPLAPSLMAQSDVGDLVSKLHREKDDCDLAVVEKIGRARSREAAVGLADAYERCATLLFRREITKTLGWFANLPESQQPALDKLAAIAGATEDEVMRGFALRGVGESATIGKQLLYQIIASKASDDLRLAAMEHHVRMADATDAEYYRSLWNLERKQQKDESGAIRPLELNAIRLLAFEGLLPQLTEKELVETLKREYDPKIRRRALDWMDRRDMGKAADMATWLLDRVDFPGADRAAAARIVAEAKGPKCVSSFLKLAKKRDVTQADLRLEMARLLSEMSDAKVQKKLAKLIGKGKPHEKVFALQATVKLEGDKLLAKIRKQLGDKSAEVRSAAAQALGVRRDRESVEPLRELLADPVEPSDRRAALEALNEIKGGMSSWLKEIAGYAADENPDVRNAAVAVLAKARDKRQLPAILAALKHPDWSTRYLAVDGLVALRQAKAVADLIERMQVEVGRMKKHVAEALWQLTAQPFEEDGEKWARWWQTAKSDFKVATEKELDKADKERVKRRLTQRTTAKAKFFGIKVESHRVIFVLDVSGSMLEAMYGRTFDGRPAARIDIAKQELTQAIENLDGGALFNIYAFSTGVARWHEQGIGTSDAKSRTDALTWVERLGASGGTNLYDSMEQAFDDPDVDTIFVMSDGEPTTGAVIDPFRIREAVAKWNRFRKVKIHTIAVGGNLEVLEWLANDSGGRYRQMR